MPVPAVPAETPHEIFLSQFDIIGQMNAESGIDEPETPVEAEKPAETPADETVLEASAPEKGNHPEWLVDRAIDLTDLTADEVSDMTTSELSRVVTIADRAAKRAAAERAAAKAAEPPAKDPETLVEFDPALYDKDDPFVKNALAQAAEVKALKEQVQALTQATQQGAKQKTFEKIDQLFASVPDEIAAIVGKGTRQTLNPRSKEMAARGEIVNTMSGLDAAFRGTKSIDELFKMAVQANYGDKVTPAKAEEKPADPVEQELERRKAELAKTSGTVKPTNRERNDPPGEAKARAAVREKLREIKANNKDDEEFDDYFSRK